MAKESRIEWVDLLKGIAILWLVVYHMHVFDWMRSPVPVFFFLSGLFFSEGKSFGSFTAKKARALLVPLLFFFVLGVAASILKCLLQGESYSFPPLWLFFTLIPYNAEVSNPIGVGAIWFLVSLFEIYVIYYLLRIVSIKKWWLLSVAILLYVVSCISLLFYAHGSLFYLFYTFGFCIYFIVAHLLKEKVLYGKIPVWLLFVAVVVYFIRFVEVPNWLAANEVGGAFLTRIRGLLSMSGLIVLLVWLCKQLSSSRVLSGLKMNKFMLFEGRNSLTILGVHMLIMGVVAILMKRLMPVGGLYYTFLFLIIVVISNLCVLFFNRYVPFLVNHKIVESK